jgi:hypothetical protein
MIRVMDFISERRIWVDDVTFCKLKTLFDDIKGCTSRYYMCNTIISKWIDDGGNIKVGGIIFEQNCSKKHFIWICVDDDLWDNFKILCDKRKLNVNDGFRIAVISL